MRRRLVDATRENNFEDGFKRLLTELYPDNAHFIYELLQNAEDNGATEVRFMLSADRVVFEHNGKDLFSLQDVDSITGIGGSTKRDDHTKIGKFGVGFKAVFAYTNTPEICSGDYHFRIHDLFVPEPISTVKQQSQSDFKTTFTFSFDHPVKSPEQALTEIRRGLFELDANTLLFLSHIHTITYRLPDGSSGTLERVNKKNGRIQITASHPGEEIVVSHWLRFQNDVEVADDEEGTKKSCRVAIAFGLSRNEDKKSRKTAWSIRALDHGQVSIFFPAEKETSNLRFHIHAPFASTVARDSVRNCDANYQLRDHIADLVVESLDSIRDKGMLSVSFLAVLPIPSDNLPAFYEPIRSAIVNAFNTEPLTPTKSGSHSAATSLYRGPARISEVLSDSDLSLLTDYAPPLWAANPPQQNQREDRFLLSLEIDNWDWEDLAKAFNFGFHADDEDRIPKKTVVEDWIRKKDDAWLMRFYALLGEARIGHYKYFDVCKLSIVRIESDAGDIHVNPRNAFFPPEEGFNARNGVHLVKGAVYNAGRSDAQKQAVRTFLEYAGVRPFDEKAAIQLKLDAYRTGSIKIGKEYISDIKKFIAYWKNHAEEHYLFIGVKFLVGEAPDGKLDSLAPGSICLDSPYLETGLASLTKIHKKHVLWAGYQQHLKEAELNNFVDFLKIVDIMHQLQVKRCNTWGNTNSNELRRDWSYNGARRTSTEIDEDYIIPDIEEYLNANLISAKRLVWNALIEADSRCAKARYRPNQTYFTREVDSQFVYHLKHRAWIPDKAGALHKPQDMIQSDLPTDFIYDDRNRLLTAIGFGENAKKRNAEYQERNHLAQTLGFDSFDNSQKLVSLHKLLNEKGVPLDQVFAQYNSSTHKQNPEFPSKQSSDPDRRRIKVRERLKDAQDKQYRPTEGSSRMTRSTIGPDLYLRNMYTNEEGQMICQICQEELPFKKRDGNYYFEAVETLAKQFFPKEYEAQFLALCPVCAARYKEFIKRDDELMEGLKELLINSDDPTISLQLGELAASIRFVDTHFLDLKVSLENED
jgi:hypothetical protein